MKNQPFITGFLAASCLFLLVNATTTKNQTTDIPRYHIVWNSANGEATAYDAVTGEMEIHKYRDVDDDSNIKDLLVKKK